jgi:putative membrane protein
MSNHTIARFGATLTTLTLVVTPIFAANAQDNSEVKQDSAFIRSAAYGGLAEIRLGKLANGKAVSKEVKGFGQEMEMDHSRINQDLDAIATAGVMSIPDRLSPGDQQTYDLLTKTSGPSFDAAYMDAMVRAHGEAVTMFGDEQRAARSQAVRDFTKKTLPMLEKHLDKARQIAARVGSGVDTTKATEHADRLRPDSSQSSGR